MTKFYAQEKQVFDINKVTVVGSPTITSDGVASGLLQGVNTIKLYTIDVNAMKWKLQGRITPISTPKNTFYIVNEWNAVRGFSLYKDGSNNQITFDFMQNIDGTETRFTLSTSIVWQIGKTYDFYIERDNGTFKIGSKELNEKTYEERSITGKGNYPLVNGDVNLIQSYAENEANFDLTQFKIYVDNELVYSPTKPVYSLERRKPMVWDKEQFTIVGNPSISESGVASGFSSSDYITVPLIDYSKPFEIKFRVKFNDNATTAQGTILALTNFNDYNNLLKHYYSNNKITIQFIKNGVNVGSKYLLDPNIDYDVIFSWNGSKYLIKAKESYASEYNLNILESDNNEPISISSLVTSQSNVIIGARIYGQQFLGSIDLKQFKIYTDNNLVFDGGAETYVYDPSKFTVVGTPTITEYGVASGINTTNYLANIPITYTAGQTFRADFEYTPTETNTNNIEILFAVSGANNTRPVFVARYQDSTISFSIGTNTINKICTLDINKSYKFQYNTDCLTYCNLIINGVVYDLPITNSLSGNDLLWKSIALLKNGAEPRLVKGSSNLPQFSITVDGKEVFTGAKEKFYAMRGM